MDNKKVAKQGKQATGAAHAGKSSDRKPRSASKSVDHKKAAKGGKRSASKSNKREPSKAKAEEKKAQKGAAAKDKKGARSKSKESKPTFTI